MKFGVVLYTDLSSKHEFCENRISDSHAVNLLSFFPSFLTDFGEFLYRRSPNNATEQLLVL
jgi:hypothetical protein